MTDDAVQAVRAALDEHRAVTAGWPGGMRCRACGWEDRAFRWQDHMDAVAVAAAEPIIRAQAFREWQDEALSEVRRGEATVLTPSDVALWRAQTETDLRAQIAAKIEAHTAAEVAARYGWSASMAAVIETTVTAARIARGGT